MERVNETMLEEPSTYTDRRCVSHSLILDSGSIESTHSLDHGAFSGPDTILGF